ncbi:MAG: iron-containing redox enzyme family protein [Pseudomonadota bacterium]|uniref:iron-containing redox enzyme family protein n=1 Tax=unclassified Phenylobacterium TaxID=2640670 RepID=UPI000701C132|nr:MULTISPECIES: iron-containing redox enzyme family protein [unclassified Phenylobacterium]KRB49367.1 3-oxoacyl-ACP synthase [Phenylobacterium sp. Root700]MBT9473707.1 iron-containing redox enzyme family protein [Phenylobacterium sp.]
MSSVSDVLRQLTVVFTEFEGRLEQTPLIRKLTRGRFALADYHAFLIGLRQQVKDGALWMSRAASNVDDEHLELRSSLMRHAVTEHRDFRLLEADYVAAGGELAAIRGAEKNIGSEALSAWMFHEASKPNPFGLLGAMWIIEGLGSIKAAEWGALVRQRLDLPDHAVRFLLYHGENDVEHIKEFEEMLAMVLPDAETAARIVKSAQVTARLYALQIEEITA